MRLCKMKKITIFISVLIISLLSICSMNAQTVKFYLEDGSYKEYNIQDFNYLSFENANYNSLLTIYRSNAKPFRLFTMSIDSITFSDMQTNPRSLYCCHLNQCDTFDLSKIDSIVISPWQNPKFNYKNIDIIISGLGWEYYEHQENSNGYGLTDSSSSISIKDSKEIKNTTAYEYYDHGPQNKVRCDKCLNLVPPGDVWFCENSGTLDIDFTVMDNDCYEKHCSFILDTANSIIKSITYYEESQVNNNYFEDVRFDIINDAETFNLSVDIPYTIDKAGNLNAEFSKIDIDKNIDYSYHYSTDAGLHAERFSTFKRFTRLIPAYTTATIKITMTK